MNISKFNISKDFIATKASAAELKKNLTQSHRTQACIFALCCKGVLKITINLTKYRVGPNDLIAIPPESLFQVVDMSNDIELYIVMYSQQLIQDTDTGKNMMDKFHMLENNYIIPLPKIPFQLYEEMFTLQAHLYKEIGHLLSHPTLHLLLALTLQGISELFPEQAEVRDFPGSKHFQQYRIFLRMVHTEYIPALHELSPEMTRTDELVAMLIMLDLSSEEIRLTLGVSRVGVNKARSRMRKRLGLESKTKLEDFLKGVLKP